MAFRYLMYRTSDYGQTIVRESTTNNPTGDETSLYTDFIIPEIQPLYLWRVTGGTNVVPNTDQNISDWVGHISPPPEPDDNATVGFVTGETATKIDKVTGATGYIGTFLANGNLEDSGYQISDLTGGTEYVFTGSGGTQVFTGGTNPTEIIIYSAPPTGSTVAWGDITGTLSGQTDLHNALNLKLDITDFNSYTGTTETALDNKLESSVFNTYTGDTQPIIDAALTGVTSLGTGTTLGGVSGRNATIKSISVLGGLTLSGDANNLIISGQTGDGAGTITGGTNGLTTNGQNIELGGNLSKNTSIDGGSSFDLNLYNLDEFNISFGNVSTLSDFGNNGGIQYAGDYSAFYIDRSLVDAGYVTGLTSNLQGDIDYLSGQTDLKLNISDFNVYSGATDTRITDNENDITTLNSESLINITGATNGLSKSGSKLVKLGGDLTEDTVISGTTHDFTLNVADVVIQSAGVNGVDIIDAGAGSIDIESDGGSINLVGNTALGVQTTKLEISETTIKITDSRGTPVGLEYAADYSSSFSDESLITKRYADAVVSGLDLKESVKAATTSGNTDIDLLGGTFGGTIDGYTVQDGDRVLIKNQDSSKKDNGIWIYSSGSNNFARAIDFNNPNVTSGAFSFIETGSTLASTGWVLVTQDPITVGTTPLAFTQFSQAGQLIAGTGININANTIDVDGQTLAGNSISWTGDTFNVDINSGTLSTALNSKLNISDFNTYSGTTDTRITDNENDIVYLSGQTDLKLNISDFNTYSGTTDTRITDNENDITYISGVTDTKLDTEIFTGYTASTVSNEIFLTHTGGTDVNTIIPTAIEWDSVEVSGTSFLWSGGSDIYIKEAGGYEINYNIPFNSESVKDVSIGGNIVKNNSSIIDVTAAAGGGVTNTGTAGSVGLPTVIVTLALDDKLTLGLFRTEKAGTVTSSLTGSILIKKKNTLQ